MVIPLELPAIANQRQFHDNEPNSSTEQEPGELAFALAASAVQVRAGSRQQDESGRAEMRDPARQKHKSVGLRAAQIQRLKTALPEISFDMVERHHYHHEAAKEVD